ncbi:MAG: MerR family transcriptional regulator [Leptospiraceae bacterium]|nr:MerR family transcriptional regulator [Leptospiraceae bacterium]
MNSVKNGKYTIGKLALEANVNVETVRYYQRRKLLRVPPRPDGMGFRQYNTEDLTRIRFIQNARDLGFSLNDVQEFLNLQDSDEYGDTDARSLANRKMEIVRQKINTLEQIQDGLEQIANGEITNGHRARVFQEAVLQA